jgi:hypothetical protein
VRWQENGKELTRTRDVMFNAGDDLNLTFGPNAAEAARR